MKQAEKRIVELYEQVTAASRAKDEFIATLAHELRNPLAPILNAVEVLRVSGPPSPELQWARDVIDRQVRHMARLLEDLLDVSRIARDKLVLREERVDVVSVVSVAVETSRPLIDKRRHDFRVTLPGSPVFVDGDPVRLAQVLSNLLNNAAKYTPEGGKIELAVEAQGRSVVVSVRDDGMGIEAELLPKVFELFTQAAPALERAQGGLGIGLSLVRGLVELHGGSVVAESDGPDRGSTFVVTLPRAEVTAEPVRPTAAIPTIPSLAERVLVVDDNEDSADTLTALLEMLGCDVATAYGGPEALALGESFQPTVVLLDIGMPGMSGIDVATRLREAPWGNEVFLIAMTGWGQPEDRRKTREAGFDHHLVKPLDARALTALLAARARPASAS